MGCPARCIVRAVADDDGDLAKTCEAGSSRVIENLTASPCSTTYGSDDEPHHQPTRVVDCESNRSRLAPT
jgi:hypothetical protein